VGEIEKYEFRYNEDLSHHGYGDVFFFWVIKSTFFSFLFIEIEMTYAYDMSFILHYIFVKLYY